MGGRTPFVALAVPRYFCPSVVAIHHPRNLGKECRETESSAKRKASGKTAKVNDKLCLPLSLLPNWLFARRCPFIRGEESARLRAITR